MPSPIRGLYTIADNSFRAELTPVQLAEFYLRGGARVVQLRIKKDEPRATSHERLKKMATAIMQLKQQYNFTFLINDHVDVALEVGADGVHVGADDMAVAAVRKKVGPKMLIGYSSHSLEEARAAQKAGADYVAFGAIFSTKTKGPGHPVQGLEKLQEVVQALSVPVVAIGGIGRNNFQQVRETGAAAIAMITALTNASDIVEEVRRFL